MSAIDDILAVAEAFAAARSLSESRVSTLCFGEGTRLKHLRAGGDMGARRIARALEWFSAHWPPNAVWPAHVERPIVGGGEDVINRNDDRESRSTEAAE